MSQNCDDEAEKAIDCYSIACDRFYESTKIFGERGQKDMVLHVKHNIGYVQMKTGNLEDAFQCYQEIIKETRKLLEDDDDKCMSSKIDVNLIDPATRSKLLVILRVLLDAHVEPPNAMVALTIMEDLLKLVPTEEANKLPNFADEMSRLSILAWKSHRAVEHYEKLLMKYHQDADSASQQQRQSSINPFSTAHPIQLFSILSKLGHAHFNQQHYTKAFGCYEGAMQILRMHDLRLKAGSTLRLHHNMGYISYEIGDYLAAVQYYECALNEHRLQFDVGKCRNGATNHARDDSALQNNTGNVLLKLNEYHRAIKCYSSALDGKRKYHGDQSEEVAGPLINLASVYMIMDKKEMAIGLVACRHLPQCLVSASLDHSC